MSNRQLRKLRQCSVEEDSEVARETDLLFPARTKPSHFAILQDDNIAEEKTDEDSDKQDLGDSGKISTPTAAFKRPKKSKKKKQKLKSKAENSDSSSVRNLLPEDQLDEIDTAIQALNLKSGEHNVASTTSSEPNAEYERVCALLCINSHRLKVANEMRNLFGQASAETYESPRAARRRHRDTQQRQDLETALKGHHAPGKGLPELTLKRNLFIQGKDEWPRGTTGGLNMEAVNMFTDGTVEFRFSHSHAYARVQAEFMALVEIGDPQGLVGHLIENPYNISLLLQVSKIAKNQGDHALSSDLIERALFSFARATTFLFGNKFSQGKARLDFSRPENREFWLAGWQYIRSLQMKGTYRTAFEWAKLLLGMNPEQDPYCMLLIIPHLSLRAFEAQYLLEIKEAVMSKVDNAFISSYITPSLALAAMQLRDGAMARSFLRYSIEHLPWLYCRLFQELNLDDVPSTIWGATPRTDAENLLSELYVHQNKDLWNTPEATSLLMEVAHVAEKLQEAMIPQIQDTEITLDIARFIYLDNTPTLMALVPSKLLHRTPNSDSDPLPPDSNTFSYESQQRPWSASRGEARNFLAHHFAVLRDMFMGPRSSSEGERGVVESNDIVEQNTGETTEDAEQGSEPISTGRFGTFFELFFGSRNLPEMNIGDTELPVPRDQGSSGSDGGGEHHEEDVAD